MERPSKSAADFVRQLAELAYRLAAKDIVVASLHADWSGFGCWELLAQNGADTARYAQGLRNSSPSEAVGPELVRVLWDGREGILSVQASPTRVCNAPNEWKDEYSKGFKKAGDDLLRFVEDYLTKRLGE